MSCQTQYKDATPLFMEQIDVIKRLVDKYDKDLTFVTSAEGKICKHDLCFDDCYICIAFYNGRSSCVRCEKFTRKSNQQKITQLHIPTERKYRAMHFPFFIESSSNTDM